MPAGRHAHRVAPVTFIARRPAGPAGTHGAPRTDAALTQITTTPGTDTRAHRGVGGSVRAGAGGGVADRLGSPLCPIRRVRAASAAAVHHAPEGQRPGR